MANWNSVTQDEQINKLDQDDHIPSPTNWAWGTGRLDNDSFATQYDLWVSGICVREEFIKNVHYPP